MYGTAPNTNGGASSLKFEDLSPEMQEKVRACKTAEEVLALAKEVGHDLTDDELDQIAGGAVYGGGTSWNCPNCNSTSHHTIHTGTVNQQNVCNNCGCIWD